MLANASPRNPNYTEHKWNGTIILRLDLGSEIPSRCFSSRRTRAVYSWWIARKQYRSQLSAIPKWSFAVPSGALTWIPWPLSVICSEIMPPPFATTAIEVEPASRLFSNISLTADAGRWITSPAAMRFTTASSNFWIPFGPWFESMFCAQRLSAETPQLDWHIRPQSCSMHCNPFKARDVWRGQGTKTKIFWWGAQHKEICDEGQSPKQYVN